MNRTMREHLHGLARAIEAEVSLQSWDIVVDIGCNDGTLFDGYTAEDIVKVGYDLSENAIEGARDRDAHVLNEAFSADSYNNLFDAQAKVITAIAMSTT